MSEIKFPNLHKGVTKISTEEFVLSDYIYVHKHHAFVIDQGLVNVIGVDLATIFSFNREPVGEDEVDQVLEQALNVLDFLNGHFIPPNFWNELVTADEMIVVDHIKDPYIEIITRGSRKKLYHVVSHDKEYLDGFRDYYKKFLESIVVKGAVSISKSSIDFAFLSTLNSMFGTKIKGDVLILEHLGDAQGKRFTFQINRHIFGVLNNNLDAVTEMYTALTMENYTTKIDSDALGFINSKISLEVVKK